MDCHRSSPRGSGEPFPVKSGFDGDSQLPLSRLLGAAVPTAGGVTGRVRPAACQKLSIADLPEHEVVLVLEGEAKRGVQAGQEGRIHTVHAPVDLISSLAVVTAEIADRLRERQLADGSRDALTAIWRVSSLVAPHPAYRWCDG